MIDDITVCKEEIRLAEEKNRIFLRQTLQAKLVRLYNETNRYKESLQIGNIFKFLSQEKESFSRWSNVLIRLKKMLLLFT